ncbi:hypothetical protein HMPREF0576_0211 [Mobiluncus holmesii ATCC 35242]|uniref:Uncharacterized protein n=1 Tax=Mobiluncus holmesii ATCC 35242 TaxID=887899 RepID=E6M1Y6_9ACTO|nr:hypothetical protein HMPREF0576_0211 [Mobiluncus holmesii ATCC 35242]
MTGRETGFDLTNISQIPVLMSPDRKNVMFQLFFIKTRRNV